MAFNDTTNYQSYSHDPSDFVADGCRADFMSQLNDSFNAAYEMSIMGLQNGNMDELGMITEPRPMDEDALMKTLFTGVLRSPKMINEAEGEGNLSGILQNGMDASGIFPLVYQSPNNGDQLRRFGSILVDAPTDHKFRVAVGSKAIPDGEESLVLPTDPNEPICITFDPSCMPSLNACGCNCAPNCCDNTSTAEQTVYIIRRGDFDPCKPCYSGMGRVVESGCDENGCPFIKIMLTQTSCPCLDAEGNPIANTEAANLGGEIKAEDILLFGSYNPSSSCLSEIVCDEVAPVLQSYCSVSRDFQFCMPCVNKDRVLVQPKNRLPAAKEYAWKLNKMMRNNMHQFFNDLLWSKSTYAAGQKKPMLVEGSDPAEYAYSDCDTIPYTFDGLMAISEKWSQKVSHYFTSCDDICGQFKLGRILETIQASAPAGVYSSGTWVAFGDVKSLLNLGSAMRANTYIPTTMEEAQMRANQIGASFGASANSMFGATSNPSPSQRVQELTFGNLTLRAIHDDTLALTKPGKIWIMDLEAFEFFTHDMDGLMRDYMGENYFLNTTGARGRVVPTVSANMQAMNILGQGMTNIAAANCNLCFMAYMHVGVHPKANKLPYFIEFSYGAKVIDDAGTPDDPSDDVVKYGDLSLLECGCAVTEDAIDRMFNTWYCV